MSHLHTDVAYNSYEGCCCNSNVKRRRAAPLALHSGKSSCRVSSAPGGRQSFPVPGHDEPRVENSDPTSMPVDAKRPRTKVERLRSGL
eukprot:365917-Chlamydomonas_euryale.AAC.5